MRNVRLVAILGLLLLLLVLAVPALADLPFNLVQIELDNIKGPKGSVAFTHQKHAKEYKKVDGAAIVCKDCHHTQTQDTPGDIKTVKRCISCHVEPGEAQVNHDGKKARFVGQMKGDKWATKSIIYHGQCIGCHKPVGAATGKKLGRCKTCHQKK